MFPHFSLTEVLGDSVILLVLIGCSVVTLGVALERAHYFRKRGADPRRMLTQARRRIQAGETREAVLLCESCPHPLGPVAVAVLKDPHASAAAAEERLQIGLSEQKLLLEKHLGILGTMAATAPLIGLLGTVWGIMRAFGDMARAGSAGPAVVAAGVAEALVTTAAGLIIAIPSVMLYNHFNRRMTVMLITAENQVRAMREALPAASRPGSRSPEIPATPAEQRRQVASLEEQLIHAAEAGSLG